MHGFARQTAQALRFEMAVHHFCGSKLFLLVNSFLKEPHILCRRCLCYPAQVTLPEYVLVAVAL